jgi:hypothetical protein
LLLGILGFEPATTQPERWLAINLNMEVTVTHKNKKSKLLYQIKVTLVGSKPPIWRRLIVKNNIKLDQLHTVLQVAMGWFNCHLHQYRVGSSYIGIPDPDFDMDVVDERKVYLQDIITNPNDSFVYEYDFGDGWEHKIVLEKIVPLDSSESTVVIKGKKACPPEDCGGIWGYSDFLDAIQDPKHEEHESMIEWVGGEFDPDEFDMKFINKNLKDLKL